MSTKAFKMDFHNHTEFSVDSSTPIEDHISAAVKYDVTDLAITDHMEFNLRDRSRDWILDKEKFFATMDRMEEKYGQQIQLYRGVELGIQREGINLCEDFLEHEEFDFVLASLHSVGKQDIASRMYYEGKTALECIQRYYDDFYESLLKFKNYSVLGHLDLYLRYHEKPRTVDYELYADMVDDVLKLVIADGKGLEINVGALLGYGLNEVHPSNRILKRYKEFGGKILTIGSDSHTLYNLGEYQQHYPEVVENLKSLGFDCLCTYKQGKPIFNKI